MSAAALALFSLWLCAKAGELQKHQAKPGVDMKTIWIAAFPRTMSSTLQSFLCAGLPRCYALFEPCHQEDETAYGPMTEANAARCMEGVLRCDFSHFINHFRPENLNQSAKCADADNEWRVFKTANIEDLRAYVLPQLEAKPWLQAVHIERDPRAIYSSTVNTIGFDTPPTIESLCNTMARNLNTSHPRLHKVAFKEVAERPRGALGGLLRSLGFGGLAPAHEEFIAENFDNPDCTDEPYGLCRSDSSARVDQWEDELSAVEERAYLASPSCRALEAARASARSSHHGHSFAASLSLHRQFV